MKRVIPDFSKDARINSLSSHAEIFFRRLWNKADDYGRYDARPLILKAELFPLKDGTRSSDITRWLAECEKAGIIARYTVRAEQFLLIKNFNQRVRAAKSEYPPPPKEVEVMSDKCQTDVGQMSDTCPLEEEVEVEVEKKKKKKKNEADASIFDFLNDAFASSETFREAWEDWIAYRRERRLPKWTESTLKRQAKSFLTVGPDSAVEMIQRSIANGWQGLFKPNNPPSTRQNIDYHSLQRAFEFVSGHFLGEYDSDPKTESDLKNWAKEEGIFERLNDRFSKLYKFVFKT